MKTIKQSYHIHSTPKKVWQALIKPAIIEKWGGGPAKMDDKVGTKFQLWGGDVWGENIEVLANKKLVQEWYGGKWSKPSLLTFTLEPEKTGTRLDLFQTDVPENEVQDIAEGWKAYYLGPLKTYLES
ncbi:MAG: SRPBCC domain-containing protein [Patescibacteria group bacterium]|jgi:activator of HSP90 ATPase